MKIYEVKTKQELDAWTTYSYLTEPSLDIKYIKNLEDSLFFQGSGASRRRIAPYHIPPLKNTDPEVLRLIDEYHQSVKDLEKVFNLWNIKRVEMLSQLRLLSGITPKSYDNIAVILSPNLK